MEHRAPDRGRRHFPSAGLIIFSLLIVTLVCPNCGASKPAEVWRYLGSKEVKKDGQSVLMLYYEHPGQYFSMLKMEIFYSPIPSDPRVVKIVASLRGEDLILLTFSSDHRITNIEKYPVKPGEDMPGYYEFVRMKAGQFKGQEFPVIVCRRFLRENEYFLGKMDADKKWIPDSDLTAKAGKLVKGAPVEIEVVSEEPGVWRRGINYFVQRLDAYKSPQTGRVIGVREVPPADEAECFTNKARNSYGRKKDKDALSLTVDIKPDGSDEVKSFLAWEYALLYEAAHLKEGEKVYFKTASVKGKEQLVGLRAVPMP